MWTSHLVRRVFLIKHAHFDAHTHLNSVFPSVIVSKKPPFVSQEPQWAPPVHNVEWLWLSWHQIWSLTESDQYRPSIRWFDTPGCSWRPDAAALLHARRSTVYYQWHFLLGLHQDGAPRVDEVDDIWSVPTLYQVIRPSWLTPWWCRINAACPSIDNLKSLHFFIYNVHLFA